MVIRGRRRPPGRHEEQEVKRQVSAGPAPMIAVLYEHPEFAELDRRRLPHEPIAAALRSDPGEPASRHFPPSARPVPSRLMPAATRLHDSQGDHPMIRRRP